MNKITESSDNTISSPSKFWKKWLIANCKINKILKFFLYD